MTEDWEHRLWISIAKGMVPVCGSKRQGRQ
jgi:hypothetical protein